MDAQDVLSGRYRLEYPLGQGGMSVVWRAHDQVLGRSVAVKVLAGRYAEEQMFRTAISREAKAAARLSHPHVANVYDYGESLDADGEPVPYVVMELLAGRSLADRIAESPMVPRVALRVCAQVAGALAAAHANDLVHRDVKPGNIMLTAAGAKVFDFGISAVAGAPDRADEEGRIFGTLAYMAPERLVDGTVLPASDVYALGLLLCRMLTGQLPPWAGDPIAFLAVAVPPPVQPLPEIDGVPPEVGELYLRCVSRNPEHRPTAREATVVLAAAAGIRAPLGESSTDLEDDSMNLTHDRAPLTVETERSGGKPWKRVAAAGAAVVVVGAVVAALGTGLLGGRPVDAADTPHDSSVPAIPVGADASNGASPKTPAGRRPSSASPGGTVSAAPVDAGATSPTDGGPSPTEGPSPTATPSTSRSAAPLPPVQPTPTATAPPAPVQFTSLAGLIEAKCVGELAQITGWFPDDGYSATTIKPGPLAKAKVVFTEDATGSTISMIVKCPGGVPTYSEKANDPDA